jgi:hypothetical protein
MSWIGDELRKLSTESVYELAKFLSTQNDINDNTPPEKSHEYLKARGFALSDRLKENCKILEQKYGVGVILAGEYLALDMIKSVSSLKITIKSKKLRALYRELENKGYYIVGGANIEAKDRKIKKISYIVGIAETMEMETGRLFWKRKHQERKPVIMIHENKFVFSMNCLDKPELRKAIDLLVTELYGLRPK